MIHGAIIAKIIAVVTMTNPAHVANYAKRIIIILKIASLNAKNVHGILIILKIAETGKIIMKLSFLKT